MLSAPGAPNQLSISRSTCCTEVCTDVWFSIDYVWFLLYISTFKIYNFKPYEFTLCRT